MFKIHFYPVSFRKYSLILIYFFICSAVSVLAMEFYFEQLYGDLTRVGHFSEYDFGWTATQPAIASELLKDYPLTEAEILIIGDSFSTGLTWQTRLVADNLKVGTMHWDALKIPTLWGALPSDLGVALRAAGFKGRYLVIESVERLFQLRMKSLPDEHNPIDKPKLVVDAELYSKRKRMLLSKLNGAGWDQNTLFNKIRLSLNSSETYLKSEGVQAVKINGCPLFSHRLCDYVLFTDGDFEKKTFNSIANVLTINKNLQMVGIQPIWVVIPDKATVYLGYGEHNDQPYQNIWQQFAQYPELIAPDLGTVFIERSRTVKDFYMPNDTHLSTNGFLYLGDFMSKGLHKLQANQPNPFSQ